VERTAPDEIEVFIECRPRLLFHYAHDGPNRGVPVVVDERHIVRLFEVHPRKLEERCEGVYFILPCVSQSSCSGLYPPATQVRTGNARPHLAFEYHTRVDFRVHLNPIVPCIVRREEATQGGAGMTRSKGRLRSSPPQCLSLHGRVLGSPQPGKRGCGNGETTTSVEVQRRLEGTNSVCCIAEPLSTSRGYRGEDRRNVERREIVPDVLGWLKFCVIGKRKKTYRSDYESQVLLLYIVLIGVGHVHRIVKWFGVATRRIEITDGSV
jgi:hypothetical protein